MSDTTGADRTVALVLAGGGARGAYEIGALAELLALSDEDQPQILVGTSIGALNSAILAATADEPLPARMEAAMDLWRGLRYENALESLASFSGAKRLLTVVADLVGVPGVQLRSLLDPTPLGETLEQQVSFDDLHRNIGTVLQGLAVVATSAATNLSVVFHEGGASPPPDPVRGIRYVETTITARHVLASAAIPVAFPAAGRWRFRARWATADALHRHRTSRSRRDRRDHCGDLQGGLRPPDGSLRGSRPGGARANPERRLEPRAWGSLSYLFLTPELVEKLFALGRLHARAWLEQEHDDGIWQLTQLR